jgi:hypothetical protein
MHTHTLTHTHTHTHTQTEGTFRSEKESNMASGIAEWVAVTG